MISEIRDEKKSTELASYYFHEGTNSHAYDYMGVHRTERSDGKFGYVFRVFAYKAQLAEVLGDFDSWSGIPMRKVSENGIWELEVVSDTSLEGMRYKYRITSDNGTHLKSDPYAKESEWGVKTASVVRTDISYEWHDEKWLSHRRQIFSSKKDFYPAPMNIYEVHLGSWKTRDGRNTSNGDAYLNYREIAEELSEYVNEMGYTHVELLPITEYPYDGSWGYQSTGYFAPTSRFGSPVDFKYFIDVMHLHGIGVILDWVPAHFPKDEHGLYNFDGHRMYEYQGDDRVENKTWGTRYFDLGRTEVQTFLISSALFWFREYHIDGLRVDAVASMLYLDYDRRGGKWTPNIYGGNQNLEAIAFLRKLNSTIFASFPDVLMIAEESTAWPMVTHPVSSGGLGFNFKWNMGWSNDMLDYVQCDTAFRGSKHGCLTFAMMYSFSENFILPVSHDEVVHGKKSLLDKMFGSYNQKFANDRVFIAYMMAHPGKKMTFMGCEFGQFHEWDYENQLEWFLLDFEMHSKLQQFVKDLNHLYLDLPPMWERDFSWNGFEWIYANLSDRNTVAFSRYDKDGNKIICVFNFSTEKYIDFEIEVGNQYRSYEIILDSDDEKYGGSGTLRSKVFDVTLEKSDDGLCQKKCGQVVFDLPAMSAVWLRPYGKISAKDTESTT